MKYFRLLIVLLIFGFGLLLGLVVKNFPILHLNKEVKVYEVFQVLSTLFIGIAIPLFIKKWIEDNRIIKSLLKEETANIAAEAKKISDKFLKCYENKEITSEEKQFIIYLFDQLGNIVESFGSSLSTSFKMRYNGLYQDLKIAYYVYWNNITGGELMSESFTTVTLEFINSQTREYNEFNKAIRNFIIGIQKK